VTVLVAVPYWRTPELVERTVRSVLAQTYTDLVCVVIGDGDVPPLVVRDDRLVVHSYSTNRGAYFAQDVAIWASPFEWYAIVASDDWVDPDHIERLIEQDADLACGALYAHGEGDDYCGPMNAGHTICRGRLVRKAYEVGIYRTERYREIGAHNPAERIGQDSLTLKVMRIVAPVGASEVPTYNRLFRDGSLCTSPETKNGSPARTAMRQRNGLIVRECERIARSTVGRDQVASRIKAYRDSLVPTEVKAALAVEVDALRSKLGQTAVAA
jgi:glycosyltransferase involved in cell wall biosynthesis